MRTLLWWLRIPLTIAQIVWLSVSYSYIFHDFGPYPSSLLEYLPFLTLPIGVSLLVVCMLLPMCRPRYAYLAFGCNSVANGLWLRYHLFEGVTFQSIWDGYGLTAMIAAGGIGASLYYATLLIRWYVADVRSRLRVVS